jgi:hypothetical protein
MTWYHVTSRRRGFQATALPPNIWGVPEMGGWWPPHWAVSKATTMTIGGCRAWPAPWLSNGIRRALGSYKVSFLATSTSFHIHTECINSRIPQVCSLLMQLPNSFWFHPLWCWKPLTFGFVLTERHMMCPLEVVYLKGYAMGIPWD